MFISCTELIKITFKKGMLMFCSWYLYLNYETSETWMCMHDSIQKMTQGT